VLTTQVLNTPEWTESVANSRQENLLFVLADKWDLNHS
jgi:hypothetical protein